jgi:hypothetical protein
MARTSAASERPFAFAQALINAMTLSSTFRTTICAIVSSLKSED